MSWDKQLPGCFAGNLIFAGHPADEDRAFAWLVDLRTRGVGWADTRAQIEAFLQSKGVEPDHIAAQVADAEAKMKPWLLD